jgi:hypothetical protein
MHYLTIDIQLMWRNRTVQTARNAVSRKLPSNTPWAVAHAIMPGTNPKVLFPLKIPGVDGVLA